MLQATAALLLVTSSAFADCSFTVYARTVDCTASAPTADRQTSIFGKAFVEEYAKQNGLEPTASELSAMRQLFSRNRPAQPTPETESSRQFAEQWIANTVLNFKVNRSLWNKYGGTVVLSAFGFHIANAATIAEIELLERQGLLRFHQPELREQVFAHYRGMRGDGVVAGARAREIFARPLWEPGAGR
jgi:hypothetical protein